LNPFTEDQIIEIMKDGTPKMCKTVARLSKRDIILECLIDDNIDIAGRNFKTAMMELKLTNEE
jgi:hypothetical protein